MPAIPAGHRILGALRGIDRRYLKTEGDKYAKIVTAIDLKID